MDTAAHGVLDALARLVAGDSPEPAQAPGLVATLARMLDASMRADGAWLWLQDAELRFLLPDAAVCEALDLAADQFAGKRRWEMALREASPESVAAHKRCCERHEPFRDFAYALQTRSGALRYLSESGVPVLGTDGRFVAYLGIARDISAAVLQECALHDLEQRTACFADLARGWFWEQDKDYRFSRFWGIPADEAHLAHHRIMGVRRWELPLLGVGQEQVAAHRACVERHAPFRDFEYMLRTADGEEQWYAVSGRPMFDAHGAFSGYCGTGVRTNGRRDMQRTLARYRAIIDAANEVALGLTSELAVEQVLESIVARAVALADSDSGYVYLVSEAGDCLELRVATGIVTAYVGTRLAPGEGLSGIVWQTGEPLLVNDYQCWAWRSPQYRDAGISAIAGVPLKLEQRVIGVIGVLRGGGVELAAGAVDSIAAFAPLAALTLQYARQARELQLAREALGAPREAER